MRLEEILPALKSGKSIKRNGLVELKLGEETILHLSSQSILADDWEIVENPSERKQELAKEILKLQDQMRPMLEEWSKIE